MSGPPKSFKLSSNFSHIISGRKEQTEQFIKQLAQQKKEKSQEKSSSLSKNKKPATQSLFKFNTKSQALIDQVPIENIKKKSQSRLQSMMQDDDHLNKNKFNLLQNQNQRKQHFMKEKKQIFKKYNIDLNMVMASQNTKNINKTAKNQETIIQQEEDPSIIKPTELYSPFIRSSDPFVEPCIIQTPLLPCFSSQFLAVNNLTNENVSKKIKEGQGVWRIGKLKIKRNNKEGRLKIGDVQFIMQGVGGQGKCVSITGQSLYKLPNWKGMWIAQPTEQLFNL